MAPPLRLPNVQEQQVLDQLIVRPIRLGEKSRWDQLVTQEHYLENADLVGEQIRYVAEYQDQWLALLGWSAPAFHLQAREQWVGWSSQRLAQRRHFFAQNSRFVILADRHQLPNLATRALGLCCRRLSADWLELYKHPIVAVESFVDAELMFRGTAYKASGWTLLGPTAGYGRSAQDFYQKHDRPKQLWVRALDGPATLALREPQLPPSLAPYEIMPQPRCEVSAGKLPSLVQRLRHIVDPRHPKGRWHSWRAVLGIIVLAKLAGVPAAQRDIGDFALRLTQPQRRRLCCRRNEQTGLYDVPSESTFYRALVTVSKETFEQVLVDWQNDLLEEDPQELIVLDGKSVKSAQGQNVVTAVAVPSGRVYGVELEQAGENELAPARRLLARCELKGRLVSLDAIHTQHETAQQIVLEVGADYLLTLKGNQPGMEQSAKDLLPGAFFPSGSAGATSDNGPDRGDQPQAG